MAGVVLNNPQTCLSCLRRLTNTIGSATANPNAVTLMQSRGKRMGRPRDQGVVVRLLEDIPKWGRKDAIFRVERGRMRNLWYPNKRAEYMTADRFRQLGLHSGEIGERDHFFGSFSTPPLDEAELDPVVLVNEAAPTAKVKHISPKRAHVILQSLVPQIITFYRKPIHPLPPPTDSTSGKPTSLRSPLIARQDMFVNPETETATYDPAIFGSVSADTIVADIKNSLVHDTEASRINLEPHHIKFLGLGGGADRLKALGRWEIEICLAPQSKSGQKATLEPLKKTIEILPEEGNPQEQTTSG